jgi:hypothetical protein
MKAAAHMPEGCWTLAQHAFLRPHLSFLGTLPIAGCGYHTAALAAPWLSARYAWRWPWLQHTCSIGCCALPLSTFDHPTCDYLAALQDASITQRPWQPPGSLPGMPGGGQGPGRPGQPQQPGTPVNPNPGTPGWNPPGVHYADALLLCTSEGIACISLGSEMFVVRWPGPWQARPAAAAGHPSQP